jgi:multiple antibiotic resistance protein
MRARSLSLFRSIALAGVGLALPLAALADPLGSGKYLVDTGLLFTLFFITLGPLKLLGPFAQATRRLDAGTLRALAFKAAVIAIAALLAGGLIGRALAVKWMVPMGALQFTAGLIFFLVALKGVLAQYEVAQPASPEAAPPQPMRIAFPMLVTPYGIAAVILLLSMSADAERTETTFAMLALVMLLNLLAMIFVRFIMRPGVVAVLQVLAAVLGVMQVSLSVTIMLGALRMLGVVAAAT